MGTVYIFQTLMLGDFRLSPPLLQRRNASLKLHQSRARIVALMIAPQIQ